MHFTFSISSGAGLADQLGSQFANLYALGSSCGWHYRRLEPLISTREESLGTWGVILRNKLENVLALDRLPAYRRRRGSREVYEFLGLADADAQLEDYAVVLDLPLGELLEGARTTADINERVYRSLATQWGEQLGEHCLLRLEKDHSFLHLVGQIQEITGLDQEGILDLAAENYLRPRLARERFAFLTKVPQESHLTLVHVRLGDSIYLPTDEGPIILHGAGAYRSMETYRRNVNSTDPNRLPRFDPWWMAERVEQEVAARGLDPANVYLISDGFGGTRRALAQIAARRDKQLSGSLLRAAHRTVSSLERQFERAFAWIPPNRRVVGEGNRRTIQSLDLIMRATLILCNSGGFSAYMRRIYGPPGRNTGFVWIGGQGS